MRREVRCAVLIAIVVGGCGARSEDTARSEAPAGTGTRTIVAEDPSAEDWIAEVRRAEDELADRIEENRPSDVRTQALRIQGVLRRVGAQTGSLPIERRRQVTDHATEAGRIAAELQGAGDTGDLSKAPALLGELRTHLRAIESALDQ